MGDRTGVTVTVLTAHPAQVKDLIAKTEGDPCEEFEGDISEGTTDLFYGEVSYGEIDALAQFQALGIPYTSEWGSGGDYTEGEEHLRFTAEGTAIVTGTSKDWPINTLCTFKDACKDCSTLDGFMQLLDQAVEQASAPSWEHQLEHSKLYLTHQLINPLA
mgnify:FL=1